MSILGKLVKLAHAKPELRGDLLPLIREAGGGCDSPKLNPALQAQCKKREEEAKKKDGDDEEKEEKEASTLSELIRLAHQNPSFRKDLLPLIRKAKAADEDEDEDSSDDEGDDEGDEDEK